MGRAYGSYMCYFFFNGLKPVVTKQNRGYASTPQFKHQYIFTSCSYNRRPDIVCNHVLAISNGGYASTTSIQISICFPGSSYSRRPDKFCNHVITISNRGYPFILDPEHPFIFQPTHRAVGSAHFVTPNFSPGHNGIKTKHKQECHRHDPYFRQAA